MAETEQPKIGWIGLGGMGSRMAVRLLDAGHPLTVFNRETEKTKPFAQRGAQVAHSPQDVAEQCDVIITMVTDDAAIESVVFGESGVLAGLKPGSTLIDMSSVSPAASRRVSKAASEKGARMIDAPVSGSTPQAEQGTLAIFVGGEEDVYAAQKPLLENIGKPVFYLGASGMGTTMKLVVNTLLGTQLQTLAEAMTLGVKAGLDKKTLLDVAAQTSHISVGQKAKMQNVLSETYPTQFPLKLMYKDFGLVADFARQYAVPMPATAAAQQICAIEQARGINEDVSAVLRLMEELAGVKSAA